MKKILVFSILIIVPALLFALFTIARPATSALAYQHSQGVGAAWYNPDWHYRRPITVTNTITQTNYPVRVTLNNQFDFNLAQSNGADVRLTASDGTTDLAYWIESWNNIGLSATIWVRIPVLAPGITTFYLYYGNASAPAASNGRMTFTAFEDFESFAVGNPPAGYSNLTVGQWARYSSNPVLTPGPSAWDAAGATFASVISDTRTNQFRMYYHGIPVSITDPHQIGLATSPDGRTWTKYGSNPIMTPGPSAWDAGGVRVPMVWKEGPTDYRMLYTGSGSGGLQVGYATSTDGISWTKYASNPVFNDPTWAHGSTENWGVIKVGDTYLMWYSNLGAPRQSGIARSTDLINWAPYSTTPIFATSNIPTDYFYSQYCPFTFVYEGYYYVLVPSYTSVNDYSRYYLYRSSSPYFPPSDRHLIRVVHMPGPTGAWDAQDSDTPAILTLDIQRSQFNNNQLWLYYAGANASGTWQEGLQIEQVITPSLYGAPAGPWGSLSWSSIVAASVVSDTVYQGVRSLRLNDTGTGATSARGTFAQVTRGVAGVWVRRTSSGTGGTDLYVYGNGPAPDGLAALGGLGGTNRQFHYWDRNGFHDVVTDPITQWNPDTWYYVTVVFNTGTNTFDFVAYNTSMTELVRVNGINMWRAGTPGTYVNSAMMYTDGNNYVGSAYWDIYLVRKIVSPEPAASVGAYRDIQERVQVTGTGPLPLTYTGAEIDVTTQGSLSYLQVIRYPYSHPNGTYVPSAGGAHGTKTGRYWEIIPNNTGYTVNLTLPHNSTPDEEDKVCRWTGTGQIWDCAASGYNINTGMIWRNGVTQLSDWATGNDVTPTAVELLDVTAVSVRGQVYLIILAASLACVLVAIGLLWRRQVKAQR